MKTVCMFVVPPVDKTRPPWKNKIYTRSFRRYGFIDNRYPQDAPFPRHMEHWLVEILSENLTVNGGCFILQPEKKIEKANQIELLVGMYDISMAEDAVIITPHDRDPNKFWVMSKSAKRSILAASPNAHSIVINHGGEMWTRRRPAESILDFEAKRLLKEK